MAIIDVVKWDGTPDVFAYKFPEENLTTFTQLIVNESQEAVLFHKGKLLTVFGPGKHTLSTENIPVLENLFGIPFGGRNPFTAEIWYVNRVMSLDIKWGTINPMQLRDPLYNIMIPIRAHGQFGVQITDAEKFLVKLVGTLPVFTRDNLTENLRGMFLAKSSTYIAKKIIEDKISILDIPAHILSLSDFIKEELHEEFEVYGINLLNFYVNSINSSENDPAVIHLKELLSRKAEMDILGYTYQQQRSFDVLENAAQNEGMAGNVMGAGMGLGMGIGVGGAVGGMMPEVMKQVNEKTISCTHCQSAIPENAKFCSSCGTAQNGQTTASVSRTIICDKCKFEYSTDTKFCPGCGDLYNACPVCKADNAENATKCLTCGEKLPVKCPQCNHKVTGNFKFCPECGGQIQQTCRKCGEEIHSGFKFCPGCGEQNV